MDTIAVLTVFTVNASGQTKPDKTKSEEIFINKKGEIYNHGWMKLGFIDQSRNVIDANGKNLGRAQKNGNYYNLKGENVVMVRDKNQEM